MDKPAPQISVIIPTFNGRAVLETCLLSLSAQAFADFETVVVDNGSADGTAEMLSDRFPRVRVIRFPENTGFARAVNAGIRATVAPFLILLNNWLTL